MAAQVHQVQGGLGHHRWDHDRPHDDTPEYRLCDAGRVIPTGMLLLAEIM